MDAEDAALGIENSVPRTIEGPRYVVGDAYQVAPDALEW